MRFFVLYQGRPVIEITKTFAKNENVLLSSSLKENEIQRIKYLYSNVKKMKDIFCLQPVFKSLCKKLKNVLYILVNENSLYYLVKKDKLT